MLLSDWFDEILRQLGFKTRYDPYIEQEYYNSVIECEKLEKINGNGSNKAIRNAFGKATGKMFKFRRELERLHYSGEEIRDIGRKATNGEKL